MNKSYDLYSQIRFIQGRGAEAELSKIIVGGKISEKRDFSEKNSCGAEGAAKIALFTKFFADMGRQNPTLPPLTRH